MIPKSRFIPLNTVIRSGNKKDNKKIINRKKEWPDYMSMVNFR